MRVYLRDSVFLFILLPGFFFLVVESEVFLSDIFGSGVSQSWSLGHMDLLTRAGFMTRWEIFGLWTAFILHLIRPLLAPRSAKSKKRQHNLKVKPKPGHLVSEWWVFSAEDIKNDWTKWMN